MLGAHVISRKNLKNQEWNPNDFNKCMMGFGTVFFAGLDAYAITQYNSLGDPAPWCVGLYTLALFACGATTYHLLKKDSKHEDEPLLPADENSSFSTV